MNVSASKDDEKPLIRVFVSSPGDVNEERLAAERALRHLRDRYAHEAIVESYFWEYEPMTAHASYQPQIPQPSSFDICICILWARMGTPLPPEIYRGPDGTPYASGTEYEFEDAFSSYRANGRPDLLVYRKTAPPRLEARNAGEAEEFARQFRSVETFLDRWMRREDGLPARAQTTFREIREFEQKLESHVEQLIERRIRPDARRAAVWTTESPFRGLQVFERRHSPVFFGRDGDIHRIVERLKRQHERGRAFVLVLGPSGSGKSSLVRAGVLARLADDSRTTPEVRTWRCAVVRPGAAKDPLIALADALAADGALPELKGYDDLAAILRSAPAQSPTLIHKALKEADAACGRADESEPATRLALVVDQLEELFTRKDFTAEVRTAFATAIAALARGGRTWVVATLRSDHFERFAELTELVDLKEGEGHYSLALPGRSEIGQIIRRPAAAAGLRYETEGESGRSLDEILLDEFAASPASLPLLEFCLQALYERARAAGSDVLTIAAYREIGGIGGALARVAEARFASLSPAARDALARVFRTLVSVSPETGLATRARARRSRFRHDPGAEELIEAFCDARLFVADGDSVEVAHEALWTHWPALAEQLGREGELLRAKGRVQAAAELWLAHRRRSDLLLGEGRPLDEGRAVVAAGLLDPVAQAYVVDYVSRSQGASARKRALRIGAAVLLVSLTLASLGSAAFAGVQRSYALERLEKEEEARTDLYLAFGSLRQAFLTFDLLKRDDTNTPEAYRAVLTGLASAKATIQSFERDGDEALAYELAMLEFLEGTLHLRRDDAETALPLLLKAERGLLKTDRRRPNEATVRRNLAAVRGQIGACQHAMGNLEAALERYGSALDTMRELEDADRRSEDYGASIDELHIQVARAYGEMGANAVDGQDTEAAREFFRMSYDAIYPLTTRPSPPEALNVYRLLLFSQATWLRDLAVADREAGRLEIAGKRLEESIGFFDEYAKSGAVEDQVAEMIAVARIESASVSLDRIRLLDLSEVEERLEANRLKASALAVLDGIPEAFADDEAVVKLRKDFETAWRGFKFSDYLLEE